MENGENFSSTCEEWRMENGENFFSSTGEEWRMEKFSCAKVLYTKLLFAFHLC